MKQMRTSGGKWRWQQRRRMVSPETLSPLIVALVAVLILTGCAATEGQQPPAEPATAETVLPESADNPAMPYNGMAALPPVNDDPQQLMGLDRATLNEKLGEPALIRRDGDAEVWQYRADRCVLDLFLYGVDKKVEHVDLRDRGDGGGESVRDCFAGMLRAAMPSS